MSLQILTGDCLKMLRTLPDESVQTCVTSPPYFGLRCYGHPDQIGQEKTPEEFVSKLVAVFQEVRRVLKPDGTLWVNLGDSYNAAGRVGHGTRIGYKQQTNRASDNGVDDVRPSVDSLKPKDLLGMPWRLAFSLQADGWFLRSDIIWNKPNPFPESVTDRPTKAHEYIFMLSKQERYYYDAEAIAEPAAYPPGTREDVKKGGFNSKYAGDNGRIGDESFRAIRETRNKRTVWTVPTCGYSGAHFATYPPDLIKPCILAGSRPGDTVLDPFGGSGTTGQVALELGRKAVLIELNPEYVGLIEQRTTTTMGLGL